MSVLNFWDHKLNPITMMPKETPQRADESKKKYSRDVSTRYHLKESEFDESIYIIAKEAKKILKGIGFKRINHKIKDLTGVVNSSFYFRLNTYYIREHINLVFEDLLKNPAPKKVISEEYICSSDLKKILSIDTMQLFTLASRNKWKKTKLIGHGNKIFYLRSQVLK